MSDITTKLCVWNITLELFPCKYGETYILTGQRPSYFLSKQQIPLCDHRIHRQISARWTSSVVCRTKDHAKKCARSWHDASPGMPALSLLVVSQVVGLTTCGAAIDDKVGIISIAGFQCNVEIVPKNPTLWRGIPVISMQKYFGSSERDWKSMKILRIPCKFCTYRFITYSCTRYGKVCIDPLKATRLG